jgi:quercetin dioxygenase-like cupin family protein
VLVERLWPRGVAKAKLQIEAWLKDVAPFDAIAHVLEGEADITISGVEVRLTSGEMVLMPAHQPHALSARTRFKMLLTMLRSA